MKKTLLWLPALLLLVGMSSCLKEDDSLNGPFRSWVTVYQNDGLLTFKTDRGFFLDVANPLGDSSLYEVGDRANVLYTLVNTTHTTGSTYDAVMNEYHKAIVKPFVNDTDGVFRDKPLANVPTVIVSENYLNVLVKTYDSNESVNSLELVRYTDEETHLETDSVPVIRVRLQHNVASVKSTTTTQAVCFNLSHLTIEYPNKNGYILRFSWKSTTDEQEYDLRYNPS